VSGRPRVAMILDWFLYYTAAVANTLVDSCDVLVVMRDHGFELGIDGPARDERRALLDPRVQVCFVRGAQSDPTTLLSALSCRQTLRAFQPDVVHVQANVDWRLELIAEGVNCPRLLTLHDIEPHPGAEGRGNAPQLWVQRRVFASSDVVAVHARSLALAVEAIPQFTEHQRVVVVPQGPIGSLPTVPALPDTNVVLFFGRAEPYKGLDVLVEAAEIVRDRIPDFKVVVAGRGPEIARCRALVRHEETFDWREGFIGDEDVPSLFAECAIVVLPYREASQSGVVPLAFAYGRTVIATQVGGLPEVVEAGLNGLLVPPEDAGALADALASVLADKAALQSLSIAASATVRTGALSAHAVRDAHLAAYALALELGAGA